MIDSLRFWLARDLVDIAEFVLVVVVALVGVYLITRKSR